MIYHLGNFDDLIQSGFWVFPNIAFANSSNPIHDVIKIPVSFEPLNQETGKEGKILQKSNISMKKPF